MLSLLGNILQISAIVCSAFSIVIGSIKLTTRNQLVIKSRVIEYNELASRLFYLSGIFVLLAFLALVYGFIVSDFSLKNVFLNSSTIKPLIYKISASWASHEGSMLLWLVILSALSISYLQRAKKQFREQQLPTIILASLQLLFSNFTYFTSNPFDSLAIQPQQGLGLNPALQDVALAIHPPLLYLGNASFVASFCLAYASLLKPSLLTHHSLKLAYNYTKLGMLALTLGIGLGSWWAYRELGWGGYWFFDPVENISIMPWLTGVALHHSLMIASQTETGKLRENSKLMSWVLGLSLTSFLLCLLGFLLVRSGMLISVHAFALSQARALHLLIIFAIVTLSSLGLFMFNQHKTITYQLKTKEQAMLISNIVWLLGVVVLASGVIYPVVHSIIYQEAISVANSYYINFFIPVMLPTLLLAGTLTSKYLHQSYKIVFLLSTIITLLFIKYLFLELPSLIATLALLCSVFLILQTSYLLLVKTNYLRQSLNISGFSLILSHLGFGLLILFVTLNIQLQTTKDFIGKIGDKTNFDQFKITLHDIKFSVGPNYYRQIAEFWLEDKQGNVTILKPENRLYQVEKALSQESDIFSYLFYDLYAVLSRIDDDFVHARIYYQPWISFIWLGVFLMALGFFTSLIKKCLQS